MIERSTNLRNSRVFVAMNVILFAISLVVRFTVRELEMGSCFMWLSAGMLLVSLAELLIVQRKAGMETAEDVRRDAADMPRGLRARRAAAGLPDFSAAAGDPERGG